MRWIDISNQKYDGSPLYRWRAELVDWGEDWLVWHAAMGTSIHLCRSGTTFSLDHRSIGYVWFKRPYYAVADFAPDNMLRRYYCNVVLPPRIDHSNINFTDLDLDMIIQPNEQAQLLDVAEFEVNKQVMQYPPDIEALAWNAVDEIEYMARFSMMPFDGCLAGYIGLLDTS